MQAKRRKEKRSRRYLTELELEYNQQKFGIKIKTISLSLEPIILNASTGTLITCAIRQLRGNDCVNIYRIFYAVLNTDI